MKWLIAGNTMIALFPAALSVTVILRVAIQPVAVTL